MQPQQQSASQNPGLALALTKAIAYTENGGAPNIENPSKGKSGELASIYQYTPDTWKAVAGKYLGNPNAPLNADDETVATTARVNDWLEKGYSPQQILSMWNAGPGEPDAYTGKFSDGSSSSGINKYGVKYNVSGYVDKGMNYLSEFEPDLTQKVASIKAPQTSSSQGQSDPLNNIMSLLKGNDGGNKSNPAPASNQPAPAVAPPKGPQVAGVIAGPNAPQQSV